jgi:hypothetical protein
MSKINYNRPRPIYGGERAHYDLPMPESLLRPLKTKTPPETLRFPNVPQTARLR